MKSTGSTAPLRGLLALVFVCCAVAAQAEDGHELWLRYRLLDAPLVRTYRPALTGLVTAGGSPTMDAARDEMVQGLHGMLGRPVRVRAEVGGDGAIVLGTPASSRIIAGLELPLAQAGAEGYVIRAARYGGFRITVIAANSDIGVLYGAFGFLRLLQTGRPIDRLQILSVPRLEVRVLDHWDNLDGSVERGYSGSSLWRWQTLPGYIDPRYREYARANASIGINGAVLNNVNSRSESLTSLYIEKTAALARAFRPYGVKVYLSARFTAPMDIGGLKSADPLEPAVRAWWKDKVEEIYRAIPDFGGFLIKANSEGQPGPQDYGRSHSEGANMYADLLAPHHGIVMYRAFVYDDPGKDPNKDRVGEAYRIIHPFDGKFRDNILVQEKEGPLDFQPREPFAPLFGAMPNSQMAVEFPVTKEYIGQGADISYTGFLYEETYRADTYEYGQGSTIARIVEGVYNHPRLTGVDGVANVGNDRNWCGSIFNQANWYAYGRFAWDPESSARAVGEEWVRMTFGNAPEVVAPVLDVLMKSYPAMIDYEMPLGLSFLDIDRADTHYGPHPWYDGASRADWGDVYFHRADAAGLGFERTAAGSNAAAQYNSPLKEQFADLAATPEIYLLWFHHVPWDYTTKSGRSMWDELNYRYTQGVAEVEDMQKTWATLRGLVDSERFIAVSQHLIMQHRDAVWFRDACLAYFATFSRRPFPDGYQPKYPLDYYQSLPPNAAPE
jgi:alpha-glucuronidase